LGDTALPERAFAGNASFGNAFSRPRITPPNAEEGAPATRPGKRSLAGSCQRAAVDPEDFEFPAYRTVYEAVPGRRRPNRLDDTAGARLRASQGRGPRRRGTGCGVSRRARQLDGGPAPGPGAWTSWNGKSRWRRATKQVRLVMEERKRLSAERKRQSSALQDYREGGVVHQDLESLLTLQEKDMAVMAADQSLAQLPARAAWSWDEGLARLRARLGAGAAVACKNALRRRDELEGNITSYREQGRSSGASGSNG